jgi:hypothetical protein
MVYPSLQMQQLCAATVFLQMAALVFGTSTNNATTMTEQPTPPFKCFHQPLSACNETGCKYLNDLKDTAVCCHLKQFQFKEEMAGKCSLSSGKSVTQPTERTL